MEKGKEAEEARRDAVVPELVEMLLYCVMRASPQAIKIVQAIKIISIAHLRPPRSLASCGLVHKR